MPQLCRGFQRVQTWLGDAIDVGLEDQFPCFVSTVESAAIKGAGPAQDLDQYGSLWMPSPTNNGRLSIPRARQPYSFRKAACRKEKPLSQGRALLYAPKPRHTPEETKVRIESTVMQGYERGIHDSATLAWLQKQDRQDVHCMKRVFTLLVRSGARASGFWLDGFLMYAD